MKKNNLFLSFCASIAFFFSSCETVDIAKDLSSDEALDIITQCLAGETGGYTEFVKEVIDVYASTADSCTISGDTTFTSSNSTAPTTYSYSSTYSYTLNCVSSVPSNLSVTLSSSGEFETDKLSSTDNGSGGSTLGNLAAGQTEYDVDGTYDRNGTSVSKTGQKGTFSYTMTFNMTNVMVNKTSKQITGGTATYTLGGVSTGVASNSFNYSGTVTFDGANSATVVLQGDSKTITIN